MPKILHIITRLDMGGSAQNTLLSCIGLAKIGYDTTLVHGLSLESQMATAEQDAIGNLIQEAEKLGVKMISLLPLVRNIHPVKDTIATLSICRILKKQKPDILHTHTSKAGFVGRWSGRFANVPRVIHTPHGHVFYGHFDKWRSNLFFFLEKLTAPVTDHVIALTEGEKNDYLKWSLYLPDRISVIHSGVDIDRYGISPSAREAKRRSLNLHPNTRVVGTVGWLLPIKAPMVLLNAMLELWKSYPDIELVYVGKGPLLHSLQAHAAKHGVSDKVKFLGWREDVHEILPLLDVFVLPSLNEGMGRVLVEAMAAGKPVVASRIGGITDLVRDGKNGLLVPPGDKKALAEAIGCLLEQPNLARQMGAYGKEISRNFGLESMVAKIDSLYLKLLGS